jgi:predicted permease
MRLLDTLLHDLRHALTLFWKEKGFTATALLTLAVCLAANTAIFTVVDRVLLHPLPVPDADRLVMMFNSYPNAGADRAGCSVPHYLERRESLTTVAPHALVDTRGATLDAEGRPERLRAMQVTPSFFDVVRTSPELGRPFTPEEGEAGHDHEVILGHGLWQERFAGDPEVVGREVRIDGLPHTVVGVMPAGFHFMDPEVRLWMPLAFTDEMKEPGARHSNNWAHVGRLVPGATLEQLQGQVAAATTAELDVIPQLRQILTDAGFRVRAERLSDALVRDVRGSLVLLWGGVALVLLIGAVNIANLVLVRTAGRARELATRFAVGAGRWRVAAQLITENVLLALAGGVLGIVLGQGLLRLFEAAGLDRAVPGLDLAVDARVAGLGLAAALALGVVIAIIPVVAIFRLQLVAVFRQDGRGGTSGRAAVWLRRGLVGGQVALATVLLVGAGLLLASFRKVLAVDPGFRPEGVLTASVSLPDARYSDDDARRSFASRLFERVRALPGMVAAGGTRTIPLGGSYSDSVIFAEGYVPAPGESVISPSYNVISPGYFEAMRIPLLEGRTFDARDTAEAPRAIIVDQRLARKFWHGKSPLGNRMYSPTSVEDLGPPADQSRYYTVVGVVGEVRERALEYENERVGAYYFPMAQQPGTFFTLAVRTGGDPEALAEPLRRVVSELDPELPLFSVQTMEERVAGSVATRRSAMLLTLGFGALALFLAALGIYGVLAYTVSRRRREIGVRMALGSTTRRIFRLVMREGMALVLAGAAAGAAGAFALRRTIESQLYGVGPLAPGVLVPVALLLTAMAVVACLGPAWRATRVDPVAALSQE